MIELLHVPLRCVGVLLPAVVVLGIAELGGGVPEGDFGTFLGAMGLSLMTAALWAGSDMGRVSASTARVIIRWLATVVVVSAGLGISTTLLAPGSPPSESTSEAVGTSLFYGVPLLVAACLGVAIGAARSGRGWWSQAGVPR